MAHKFDDPQKVNANGRLSKATGEVDGGKQMFWISAVVYQNHAGHVAAAWGETKWGGGKALKWSCPTKMAPGSQPFEKGKKAKCWALARVSDGGGKFYAWGHDVDIV